LFVLPGKTLLFLFVLIYALYLTITALLFGAMLLMVSDRPGKDMTLGLLVPFFPLFMLLLRCWSAVAMLNEIFRRGHEESSMAPWWVLKRATRF
jgi:poly-beta-1,6-N-acetyl-D-glucosamine synthase